MAKQSFKQAFHIRQQGAVLVTSLVLLAILSIVGVATMRSSTNDVSIHKSMKNRANAFQCAETAVRAAEIWLRDEVDVLPKITTSKPDYYGSKQVWDYRATLVQDIFNKKASWWRTYGEQIAGMTNADHQVGCVEEPWFIIERLGIVDDVGGVLDYSERAKQGIDYFRISAFSVGVETNASVLLQTTYAKRFR